MTGTLSSTALVLHDLGVATGFGGTLFGKFGLDPAARAIASKEERGRILDDAWTRFSPVNLLSIGATAITWIIGRSMFSGRGFGPDMRNLVLAKDVFVGTALATGIANAVLGKQFGDLVEKGEGAIESGLEPSIETPPNTAAVQRATTATGIAYLFALGGIVVTTALLNFKAGKSLRWGAAARYLP